MIHYLGNIVEDIVPKRIIKKRNKVCSWSYGYNSEYDLVIISKDGTLGTIVNIEGVTIGLPTVPDDETEILNYDVPKYNQKWKRNTLPEGLNEETQYDKRFVNFIEKEWERREKGVFVYLNGEIVYLTGTSYFIYNWVVLDEGYPKFRVIQNELLIYWEACKADERCYGICYVKNRRFGWSSLCFGEQIESGTRTENSLCGIISKTGEDAKSMFNRLVRAFKKLPPFFTPIWDGTTTPKRELVLSEPTRKKSANKTPSENNGLDTLIKWYSTVLNAMDGERVFRSALDEVGKFPKETPFDKYWSIVKTSHRIGARIIGKTMCGSTCNSLQKGGLEFKNVYYQSDPYIRSKNEQTQSGLYKLFIPAQYCIEGFFDEYGFSIVDDPEKSIRNEFGELKTIGANTYLNNELEALEDQPEEYNEFLRQFPRKEEHAFRDESGDCRFDLTKIYEQLDYNDHELPESTVQSGNFYWKNGVKDGEVFWTPSKEGRFLLTWHPPEEIRNKFEWKTNHGVYARSPIAENIGAFGCDPYNRSQTVKKEGSKGSIHLSTKFNFTGAPSNEFIVEYIDRPEKVEYFFEDMIMVMRYYSMPVLIELSNENFLRYLLERGYRHFCMNRPDVQWKDLSPTEKEFGGIPAQGNKVADAQFYAIEAYINDYVGVARNDTTRTKGAMGIMPFTRTLLHWKDVDPDNRTKYDAYISASLSLLANQKVIKKQTKTKTKRKLRVSTYQNTGYQSKLIQ
ncbi:hypothetical protein [Aquimarina longa]|uniref:hypothetical protein n=1 Tax=Aquimarina longa TaxID=1080221 RepID=UPI000AB34CB5|nr:hypothetical protein [Aquimarina longa]